MPKTINRICFALGFLTGLGGSLYASMILKVEFLSGFTIPRLVVFICLSALITGFILLLVGPLLVRWVWQLLSWSESRLKRASTQDVVSGATGLIVGLIIANLFSVPVSKIPMAGAFLPTIFNLILGYLGAVTAITRRDEILGLFNLKTRLAKSDKAHGSLQPKLLDTSVLIDGRIADVLKTGFLEGPVIIPGFVLDELQHIADSSDMLKRNRGRRGLEIVNVLQRELNTPVQILDKDPGGPDVDSKLTRLAKNQNARIITNDYNLNKVAEIKGVTVLNINELANAMKPVVLPGEEITVYVVKDGKESGQGVAYLDDGTMIVIDGGKRYIGDTIGVMVTSVLQTAAGRMIFAKPKNAERAIS